MRVLVVEDDPGIAQGLQCNLQQLGWAVDVVVGISPAWAALSSEPFDVMLLDLGLADGDGRALLTRLRKAVGAGLPHPSMPVLIMTARDQIAAKIDSLDLGADDYVTKPFDMDELAARMRALCRRAVGRVQTLITHGDIQIDPAALTVLLKGQPIELSPKAFAVLVALIEASPRVLSRTQLETKLYNWESALESNAIEVHIHHLRKKLGEHVIRTVRGVGYFVPEMQES